MPPAVSAATAGATMARSSSPSMRVEAGDRQARPGETEAPVQIAGHDSSSLDDEFDRKLFEYLSKRQVDRYRHHRQFRRPQHHHGPQHFARGFLDQLSEKFGVTR